MKNIPLILVLILIILSAIILNLNSKDDIHNLSNDSQKVSSEVESLLECSKYGKKYLPIYSVKTDEPKIAISFDASWGNSDTRNILDILDKHNVKATFFLTGGWVSSYPEDVIEIFNRGHELGNHSATHPHLPQKSKEQISSELSSVHNDVFKLTGYEMHVFRPPFGDYNNTLIEVAYELGYYTIQWNVDSLDWKEYGASQLLNTVLNHKALGNGSIILMHNGAKYTPIVLDELLSSLEAKGYEFVKMSDLIYHSDFHMDGNGCQINNNN